MFRMEMASVLGLMAKHTLESMRTVFIMVMEKLNAQSQVSLTKDNGKMVSPSVKEPKDLPKVMSSLVLLRKVARNTEKEP